MSARQVKKLKDLRAAQKQEDEGRDGEGGDSSESEDVANPTHSAWNLLDDSEESDAERDSENEIVLESEMFREQAVASNTQPKRKAKKKGKNKKKNVKVNEDDDGEVLLDTIIREHATSNAGSSTPQSRHPSASVLSVNMRDLNFESELKRRFGAHTVNDEGRGARNRRVQLRRGSLISASVAWPKPPTFVGGQGIRMNCVDLDDGEGFNFEWSDAYEQSQRDFEFAQATNDPNALVQLLLRHPYNVDAMLQLGEIYKQTGEMDSCADMIKRTLYFYESSWHDRFNPASGSCRMDYSNRKNRGFYTALFRHMQLLGRTGCFVTALEVAKLLLSLDPSGDPVGVLLCIDYYALCARNFQFLEQLVLKSELEVASPDSDVVVGVGQLPNLCFSAALALHHLGSDDAEDALLRALRTYPMFLSPLLDKAGVDIRRPKWSEIVSASVFAAGTAKATPVELHLATIFAERSGILWRPEKVQAFLYEACKKIAKWGIGHAVSASSPAATAFDKYRFLQLADYSDEITLMPADLVPMLRPNGLGAGDNVGGGLHVGVQDLQRAFNEVNAADSYDAECKLPIDTNPVLLFLQTLMPWNTVGGVN